MTMNNPYLEFEIDYLCHHALIGDIKHFKRAKNIIPDEQDFLSRYDKDKDWYFIYYIDNSNILRKTFDHKLPELKEDIIGYKKCKYTWYIYHSFSNFIPNTNFNKIKNPLKGPYA